MTYNVMLTDIATQFKRNAPAVDFWSLRLLERHHEGLMVRQDILQPIINLRSSGALITNGIETAGVRYGVASKIATVILAKRIDPDAYIASDCFIR